MDDSDWATDDNDDVASDSSERPQQQPVAEDDSARFVRELEFVQCLANPRYLMFLAQRDYFGDAAFLEYLNYLRYWREPGYVEWVRYPQALEFLEMLQNEAFRRSLSNMRAITDIEEQQRLWWQEFMRRRLDLSLPEMAP